MIYKNGEKKAGKYNEIPQDSKYRIKDNDENSYDNSDDVNKFLKNNNEKEFKQQLP